MPAPLDILALTAVALAAGFVDAIAGGGGLITMPALLSVGLPPHLALGTNKAQSVFGAGAALFRFARAGFIRREQIAAPFALGMAGSLLGAGLVSLLSPTALRPLILVLLVAVAPLVLVRPRPRETTAPGARRAALGLAFAVGAYDGFFGPGTGTLLVLGLAALGRPLVAATAEAKIVNFASNLAALGLFASRGYVVLAVAVPMALAQLVGAELGARVAVRGGERVVRAALLLVLAALLVKVGRDVFAEPQPNALSSLWQMVSSTFTRA